MTDVVQNSKAQWLESLMDDPRRAIVEVIDELAQLDQPKRNQAARSFAALLFGGRPPQHTVAAVLAIAETGSIPSGPALPQSPQLIELQRQEMELQSELASLSSHDALSALSRCEQLETRIREKRASLECLNEALVLLATARQEASL